MPAWHDGTGPKGPADRGATKAKARGLFLPTSGFATYLEEPVHNMNESQKARQMGISWQARSVRRIYIGHYGVRSVHSNMGCP